MADHFTITGADIERCPIHSLSPSHYRRDGSCLCMAADRDDPDTLPQTETPEVFYDSEGYDPADEEADDMGYEIHRDPGDEDANR